MATRKKQKIKLQGHEKFSLREGWLTKGLIQVSANPDIFKKKTATDDFGMGSNMVKSLRYWMKAFRLIEEKPGKGAFLTPIGQIILDNDLFFEDVFTIWLLHSNIVKNHNDATSWYLIFNKCHIEDMEKEYVEKMLINELQKYVSRITFSEKSVKSDLDVILNMYSKSKEIMDPEDKNISPFSCLNLIKNIDGQYTKMHPDRRLISEWNVLYELADALENEESISIDRIISGNNGLANIYQMTTIVANEFLDKLDTLGYIRVNRTAGIDVIYKEKAFTQEEIVTEYYTRNR